MGGKLAVGVVQEGVAAAGDWAQARWRGRAWFWQSAAASGFAAGAREEGAGLLWGREGLQGRSAVPFAVGDAVRVSVDRARGALVFARVRAGVETPAGEVLGVAGRVCAAVCPSVQATP